MPPKGTPSPGSGPKAATPATAIVNRELRSAAVLAASKLFYSVRGTDPKGRKFKPLSMTRIKECELVIAHAIGTPRQKVDIQHSGEILTLRDLTLLAFKELPEQLPEPDNQALLQPAQDIIEGEYEQVREEQ